MGCLQQYIRLALPLHECLCVSIPPLSSAFCESLKCTGATFNLDLATPEFLFCLTSHQFPQGTLLFVPAKFPSLFFLFEVNNALKSFLCLLCTSGGIKLPVVLYGHLNPLTFSRRAKNNPELKGSEEQGWRGWDVLLLLCLPRRGHRLFLCGCLSTSPGPPLNFPTMTGFSYSEYFLLFHSCRRHFRHSAQTGSQTPAPGSGVRRRYDGSLFSTPNPE